jgi:ribosome biogenesis ATPase
MRSTSGEGRIGDADGGGGGGLPLISDEDWEQALQEVKPSVKDIDKYLEVMK